jgi:hypothetical protein
MYPETSLSVGIARGLISIIDVNIDNSLRNADESSNQKVALDTVLLVCELSVYLLTHVCNLYFYLWLLC